MSEQIREARAETESPTVEQDLAAILSAALRHPDLPAGIHNDIMDGLNDLINDGINTASPEFIRAALDRRPVQTGDRPSGGVLERLRASLSTDVDYRPISIERAEALTDRILAYDDDEQTHALIVLLHGLVHAHYAKERPDVEALAMFAAHRGYAKTVHFTEGLREFASLDPDAPDDLRVLSRQYTADEGEDTKQDRSE
ncbi:MAG: hypothetical protein M3430_14950 [Acidobacteriota bacterium]|nr:hypothetical protein [Acidobacteriota bacterium]